MHRKLSRHTIKKRTKARSKYRNNDFIEQKDKSSRDTLLRSIGTIRDGALLLASSIYLMGFICFAIASYRFKIGFIKPFDAQYFVAGLLPVTLLIITSYIFFYKSTWISASRDRLKAARSWLESSDMELKNGGMATIPLRLFVAIYPRLKSRLLHQIDATLLFTFPFIIFYFLFGVFDKANLFLSLVFYIFLLFGIFMSWVYMPENLNTSRVRRKLSEDAEAIGKEGDIAIQIKMTWTLILDILNSLPIFAIYFAFKIAPILYLIAAVFYYGWITYPLVPQEFGGLKPRCTIVAFEKTKIGDNELASIIGMTMKQVQSLSIGDKSGAYRLIVMHHSSERLLVGVRKTGHNTTSKTVSTGQIERTIDLNGGLIRATTSCE